MDRDGTTLGGRYRLGAKIGTGGMSDVYASTDELLGREVAVKMMRPDLARDTTFLERFRREAQNAARLNHPAIVAIYDTGQTDPADGAVPYIVMERVRGETLRDIIQESGKMRLTDAANVMARVADALHFSHEAGIIHRDVKPANIMITNTGAVKVMDFGIARALSDSSAAMTQTAAVIGTAQYLSPEQARGKSADSRSDIYAAGCVFYELATGRPPFEGESPFSVAFQHVQDDPVRPSEVPGMHLSHREALSLDAIVLHAMAKDPADRYDNAAELAGDLQRLAEDRVPLAAQAHSAEDTSTAVLPGAGPGQRRGASGVVGNGLDAAGLGAAAGIGASAGYTAQRNGHPGYDRAGLDTQRDLPADGGQNGYAGGPNGAYTAAGGAVPAGSFADGYPPEGTDPSRQPGAYRAGADGHYAAAPTGQVPNQYNEQYAEGYGNGYADAPPPGAAGQPGYPHNAAPASGWDPASEPAGVTPHSGVQRAPEPERPRRRLAPVLISLAAVALLLGGGFAAYNLVGPGKDADNAAGSQQVRIPTVENLTRAEAEKRLRNAGLDFDVSERPHATIPRGNAIATEPAVGSTVPRGTKVTLLTSSGKEITDVPDLNGMTTQQASKALSQAGLSLNQRVQEESSDSAPKGTVISQSPAQGAQVSRGTQVMITVSTGPSTVRVPVVTNQQVDTARSNLESAGFTVLVEEVDSAEPEGKVLQQSPSGSNQPKGSQVRLEVSRGNLFTMPDLSGKPYSEVYSELQQAGWRGSPSQVTRSVANTADLGQVDKVATQSIPAGQVVRRDSAIDVRVYQFSLLP